VLRRTEGIQSQRRRLISRKRSRLREALPTVTGRPASRVLFTSCWAKTQRFRHRVFTLGSRLMARYLTSRTHISGCTRVLRYYNVWHTLRTGSTPRQSQLWHRDRESTISARHLSISRTWTKVPVLSHNARGTHAKGGFRSEPRYSRDPDGVRRSDNAQMAEVVSPERWRKCTRPPARLYSPTLAGITKAARLATAIAYVYVHVHVTGL